MTMIYRRLGASGVQVSAFSFGASRVEQLRENLSALQVLPKLTPGVMAQLDKISRPAAD